MRHRGRLQDILHRAETGPMMKESEFEKKLITSTIQRLIKKFGIAFDGETIIPTDDDLPDRLFQAGLAFAEQVGLFCQDTSRRMLWTRDELLEGIAGCPEEALLGEGPDAVLLKSRVPEDEMPPLISGGPYGILVPEELFSPMLLSYAKESLIDTIDPPSLERAYGMTIKAASPMEASERHGGARVDQLPLADPQQQHRGRLLNRVAPAVLAVVSEDPRAFLVPGRHADALQVVHVERLRRVEA